MKDVIVPDMTDLLPTHTLWLYILVESHIGLIEHVPTSMAAYIEGLTCLSTDLGSRDVLGMPIYPVTRPDWGLNPGFLNKMPGALPTELPNCGIQYKL